MAALPRVESAPVRPLVEQLQHDLTLSDSELAAVLAVPAAVLRTSRVEDALSVEPNRRRLKLLADLHERLQDTFAPEGVAPWLRGNNRYLGGQTPIDALLLGRFDRVDAALGALDWGIFV